MAYVYVSVCYGVITLCCVIIKRNMNCKVVTTCMMLIGKKYVRMRASGKTVNILRLLTQKCVNRALRVCVSACVCMRVYV